MNESDFILTNPVIVGCVGDMSGVFGPPDMQAFLHVWHHTSMRGVLWSSSVCASLLNVTL